MTENKKQTQFFTERAQPLSFVEVNMKKKTIVCIKHLSCSVEKSFHIIHTWLNQQLYHDF